MVYFENNGTSMKKTLKSINDVLGEPDPNQKPGELGRAFRAAEGKLPAEETKGIVFKNPFPRSLDTIGKAASEDESGSTDSRSE